MVALDKRSHITFTKTDHEIISMLILPLPQVQEGQLLFTGEIMYIKHWITV